MATEREEIQEKQAQLDGFKPLKEDRPDLVEALKVQAVPTYQIGSRWLIEHDGFQGTVIGHYTTAEGKTGVVMQQDGTRVVHVYGTKWLNNPVT